MLVLLLTHILIAFGSIALVTRAVVRPSDNALRQSYSAIGATLASGTVLVLASHSNLVQGCLTGLTYLAAMTVASGAAKYRLALKKTK